MKLLSVARNMPECGSFWPLPGKPVGTLSSPAPPGFAGTDAWAACFPHDAQNPGTLWLILSQLSIVPV